MLFRGFRFRPALARRLQFISTKRKEKEVGANIDNLHKAGLGQGFGTRRRPIGPDCDAAKDADFGLIQLRVADFGLNDTAQGKGERKVLRPEGIGPLDIAVR